MVRRRRPNLQDLRARRPTWLDESTLARPGGAVKREGEVTAVRRLSQPQVTLGLSNETETLPFGSIVKCATSWYAIVLPSEPVAWTVAVNVERRRPAARGAGRGRPPRVPS